MENNKIFLGIDPDCEKSGVAIYFKAEKGLSLYNMGFFELYDFLQAWQKRIASTGEDMPKIFIEAGWMNKPIWHEYHYGKNGKLVKNSAAVHATIAKKTGANHETGRKIVEMCEYLKLDYVLIRPTETKTDATLFKKITGYKKQTNPEQRDAAMLIWGR